MEKREDNGIGKLFRDKTLFLAKLPEANPQSIDFRKYSVPLISHDYAAKTPVMWNACYREFHIEAGNVMAVGKIENTKKIFDVFRQDERYIGGGAGVGFKDESIGYLDEIDPLAKEIGAVNIIVKMPNGKLRGYNTDGAGFSKSLEERFERRGEYLSGKKIVLLGSGGTGNAIAFALAERGVRIVILNRTVSKAEALARKINAHLSLSENEKVRFGGEDGIGLEVEDADVIINVSTKGATGDFEQYSALAPAVLPASPENIAENSAMAEAVFKKIPPKAILCDVVLRLEDTPFLGQAKRMRFETLDGIPMVVYQGVLAFWLLHGAELEQKNISQKQVAKVMKKASNFE